MVAAIILAWFPTVVEEFDFYFFIYLFLEDSFLLCSAVRK